MKQVAVQYDVAICGIVFALTNQSCMRCHGFCWYKMPGQLC